LLLSLVPHLRPALCRAFFHLAKGGLRGFHARMDKPSDNTLRRILTSTRCIAVVGVSLNPVRPSYFVARYLKLKGFRIIPVNPGHAGETLFGETVRAGLADCPPEVDMVDIFRRSDHVPPIVAEALEVLPNLRTVWLQIGVRHDEAAATAQARGVTAVQDLCPKMEYQRLFGELRMGGINTGILSSRL
jgi:predicted CoA-binding protein